MQVFGLNANNMPDAVFPLKSGEYGARVFQKISNSDSSDHRKVFLFVSFYFK